MGRAALSSLAFLLIFALIPLSMAFDFEYSCDKDLSNYYYGGESIYLVCRVEPETLSDAKKMDGVEYNFSTELDSASLVVEVHLRDGRVFLHPSPSDAYAVRNGITTLLFYLPDSEKGVDEIVIRVFGYIPDISARLQNITAVGSATEKEEVFSIAATVVNKQKFLRDIREYTGSECADRNKLSEARSLFEEGEYLKAELKLSEVEKKVMECEYESRKSELEGEYEVLKQRFSDVRKNLTYLQIMVDFKKDELENYAELKSKLLNLTAVKEDIDRDLDEVYSFLNDYKFEEARELMSELDAKITELDLNVSALIEELEAQKKESSWIAGDHLWIAAVAFGIVLAAIIFLYVRNRRDKW